MSKWPDLRLSQTTVYEPSSIARVDNRDNRSVPVAPVMGRVCPSVFAARTFAELAADWNGALCFIRWEGERLCMCRYILPPGGRSLG